MLKNLLRPWTEKPEPIEFYDPIFQDGKYVETRHEKSVPYRDWLGRWAHKFNQDWED